MAYPEVVLLVIPMELKFKGKVLYLKNKLAQNLHFNMIHESANKNYKNKNKNKHNWFIHEQGKIYIILKSEETETQKTKNKIQESYK